MNIQLDNFVQFLPQDKVKEFPTLGPKELLQRTQRALGEGLLEAHQELIRDTKGVGGEESSVQKMKLEMEKMVQQNIETRRQVDQWEEREKLLARVEKMQKILPWAKLFVLQNRTEEMKKNRDQAKKESKDAAKAHKKEDAPMKRLKQEAVANTAQAKEMDKEAKKCPRKIQTQKDKFERLGSEIDELNDEFGELQEAERKSRDMEQRTLDEIAQLETALAALEDTGVAEMKKKIQEDVKAWRRNQGALEEQKAAAESEIQKQRRLTTRHKGTLKQINDQKHMMMRNLSNDGRDSALTRAYEWVRDNGHRFKKPVFGPLALSVAVPERKHAKFVEKVVPFNVKKAFVTQTIEDRELLSRELDRLGAKKMMMINYVPDPTRRYENPIPVAQLAKYGITHYLDQVIEAPEVVRRVLQDNASLHLIALGSELLEQRNGAQKKKLLEETPLARFFSPTTYYNVRKSVHTGEKMTGIESIANQSDRLWAGNVDQEAKRKVEVELQQAEAELEHSVMQMGPIMKAIDEQQQQRGLIEKREQIVREKDKQKRGVANKLRNKKSRLEALQQRAPVDRQEAGMRKEIAKKTNQRVACLGAIAAEAQSFDGALDECNVLFLHSVQQERLARRLEVRVKELLNTAHVKETDFQDLDLEYKEQKKHVSALQREAQKNEMTPDIMEFSTLLPGYPWEEQEEMDKLQAEIRTEQAKADSIVADASAVRLFQRREEQIKMLQKKYTEESARLDGRMERIATQRDNWLPRIREKMAKVNEKFSASMANMGFAGEITLDFEGEEGREDFESFGVCIQVRFKKEQMIRKLDAHTQSGGEKSVSTMLYLVALQQLTPFPFRVVDEINQGMDAANERKVFEEIIHCASVEGTSQYFVITPKLLPDLNYGEAVKLHFVWNGPCLPSYDRFHASKHQSFNPHTPLLLAAGPRGASAGRGRGAKRAAGAARGRGAKARRKV